MTMSSEGAEALKELKAPANQLLPLLERHLKSTDRMERRQALYVLGSTGDGAELVVSWLCAALKSPDVWEHILAVQSLGWIGPNARAAVPTLIDLLKAPQTPTNRPCVLGRTRRRPWGTSAAPLPRPCRSCRGCLSRKRTGICDARSSSLGRHSGVKRWVRQAELEHLQAQLVAIGLFGKPAPTRRSSVGS